jgi:hypothetical protein
MSAMCLSKNTKKTGWKQTILVSILGDGGDLALYKCIKIVSGYTTLRG